MDGSYENQIAICVARCDMFIMTFLKYMKPIVFLILILLIGLVLFYLYNKYIDKKKGELIMCNVKVRTEKSKGGNVKYTINEFDRTVKAVLKVDECEPQIIFDKAFSKRTSEQSGIILRTTDFYDKAYTTKGFYEGVARCHPEDQFDVEFGKKLALERAKRKHFIAVARQVAEITTYIADLGCDMNKKLTSICSHLHDCRDTIYDLEMKGGREN